MPRSRRRSRCRRRRRPTPPRGRAPWGGRQLLAAAAAAAVAVAVAVVARVSVRVTRQAVLHSVEPLFAMVGGGHWARPSPVSGRLRAHCSLFGALAVHRTPYTVQITDG
jgi:hypothetical protein